MQTVSVRGSIRLDSFLKWAGVTSTGGQGKILVQSGKVAVNGKQTDSRSRTLVNGDVVSVEGFGKYMVDSNTVEGE